MTTHETWTLNQVVAHNVRTLREAREREDSMWTVTHLAVCLTGVLRRRYTRFMVYDLEGRRDREVKWSELAALCRIFEVALWELVLPPEGVEVDTIVVSGEDITHVVDMAPDGTTMVFDQALPGRDDLAWLLFGLDAEKLGAGGLKDYRDQERRRREQRLQDALKAARRAFDETMDED